MDHSMVTRDGMVTTEAQHDLEKLGIAKNARDAKIKQDGENAPMAKLYREQHPEGTAHARAGQHRLHRPGAR